MATAHLPPYVNEGCSSEAQGQCRVACKQLPKSSTWIKRLPVHCGIQCPVHPGLHMHPCSAARRCLAQAEARPTATELLEDAFFLKRKDGPDVQRRPSTAALDSHGSSGDTP